MTARGKDIPAGESLRRGDIIFFPGHVGLMTDHENIVHANAFCMQVITEPLADVISRLAGDHAQPVLARTRIMTCQRTCSLMAQLSPRGSKFGFGTSDALI